MEGGSSIPWNQLLALDRISNASLARVVSLLRSNETERSCKRKLQNEKFPTREHVQTCAVASPITSNMTDVFVADLSTYIHDLAARNGFFIQLLGRTLLKQAGNDLQLVLYYDEVVPGNVIAPDNQRKSYLVYASFKEFGEWLTAPAAWLPVSVLRHKSLGSITGGLSSFMRTLIDCLQKQLSAKSIPFRIDSGAYLLRVKREFIFLQDEAALKAMLGIKGATGMKPCAKCKNVLYVLANNQAVHPYFTTISEHRQHRFDPMTDADQDEVLQFLRNEKVSRSKKKFEDLQTYAGFNLVEHGVLLCPEVRPTIKLENCLYDPMHVYLARGLVGVELALFFNRLKQTTSLGWSDFQQLVCASWTESSHKTKTAGNTSHRKAATNERYMNKAEHYKGSASELLMILPFLIFFVGHIVKPAHGHLENEVASMLAVLLATKLVNNGKKTQSLNTQALLAHQQEHLLFFGKAYGVDNCRPKHHFQFHLGPQFQTHAIVMDCFACERKNSEFKSNVAPHVKKLTGFELSTLVTLLHRQLTHDTDSVELLQDGLCGQTHDHKDLAQTLGVASVTVGTLLRIGTTHIGIGSFRIFCQSGNAFVVTSVLHTPEQHFLVGDLWRLDNEALDFSYSWWSAASSAVVLAADDVLDTRLHVY